MLYFAATTIGCKVNQYETQAALALLDRLDGPIRPSDRPDVLIVNTCCVTSAAAAKSRRAVRQAVRRRRQADVLILGCGVTDAGQTLRTAARRAGCTGRIILAGHRDNVAERLSQWARQRSDRTAGRIGNLRGSAPATEIDRPGGCCSAKQRFAAQHEDDLAWRHAGPIGDDGRMSAGPSHVPAGVPTGDEHFSAFIEPVCGPRVKDNVGTIGLPGIDRFAGRQRALVKVQDGCDAACTYCTVSRLRSSVWSRPVAAIVEEVARLVGNGHREIVLCGVFLGAYAQPTAVRRRWTAPSALPQLLARVAATPGLWRVRLSSLEPGDVTEDLIEVCRDLPNVAPHLHLPMQSGSPSILRRMNRQYGPDDYLRAVDRLREAFDRPAITTDILVGFPGESEKDFEATMDLARRAAFSRIHIFPFSARRGTPAWNWRTEAAPPAVVKDRCRRLAELAGDLAAEYRRRFLDETVEVLTESPNDGTPSGRARGLTDRYIDVTFPDEDLSAGRIVPVRIEAVAKDGLCGVRARGGR